jgi:hypothetical protein
MALARRSKPCCVGNFSGKASNALIYPTPHRELAMSPLIRAATRSRRRVEITRVATRANAQLYARADLQTQQPRAVQNPRNQEVLDVMKGKPRLVSQERIKPDRIYKLLEQLIPTTRVLPPKDRVVVRARDLPKGSPDDKFWGIGELRFPKKTDAFDDYDHFRSLLVYSLLPGDKLPKRLFKNNYDIRVYKYLRTLDQKGINICREMKPCVSTRGIVLHSKISPMAVAGGEAWFSKDEDAVTINFCSGRYPLKDPTAIDRLSKLWLNFVKKVYVVVPPQRYGQVTPTLFEREGNVMTTSMECDDEPAQFAYAKFVDPQQFMIGQTLPSCETRHSVLPGKAKRGLRRKKAAAST